MNFLMGDVKTWLTIYGKEAKGVHSIQLGLQTAILLAATCPSKAFNTFLPRPRDILHRDTRDPKP